LWIRSWVQDNWKSRRVLAKGVPEDKNEEEENEEEQHGQGIDLVRAVENEEEGDERENTRKKNPYWRPDLWLEETTNEEEDVNEYEDEHTHEEQEEVERGSGIHNPN
jgi:hypothetical protein